MKRIPDWFKLALVAFVSAMVALSVYAWVDRSNEPTSIVQLQQVATPRLVAGYAPEGTVDFVSAAQAALPTVVHVKTSADRNSLSRRGGDMPDILRDFFGQSPRGEQRDSPNSDDQGSPRSGSIQLAAGSGVIISADGYIITNNHVISSGDKISVTFEDNRTYEAKIIGNDPTTDLALLKIDAKGLPFLKFGNSDNVKVGQWVLAVGNPFDLTSTVTAGIVSAKGRAIGVIADRLRIESFIQTDAAVNPGNSGGALISTAGELIGINTAIASMTGTYSGYSFAIPSNIVTKVVDDLMNYGEVQRGLLGVQIQDVSAELSEEKKLGINQGVYIGAVNDKSAAAEAGLKVGDVITKVEGQTVTTSSQLQEQVGRRRPGDKVRLSYLRDGKAAELVATLKNSAGTTAVRRADPSDAVRVLGGRLRTLDPKEPGDKELSERAKVSAGAVVESLTPGRLRTVGVREGFIITSINDQPVKESGDVTKIIQQRIATGKTSALLEGSYPDGRTAVYGITLPTAEPKSNGGN
jgi:serine protease Do